MRCKAVGRGTVFWLLAASLFLSKGGALLAAEEFDTSPFQARREALLDSLVEGTAILYSDGEDGETGYISNTDFWYLTGLNEPGAVLVLSPNEKERQVLLLAPRDPDVERWKGLRPAITDSMTERLGYDRVRRAPYLGRLLRDRVKHSPIFHYIGPVVNYTAPVPKELETYRKIADRVPGTKIRNGSRFLESMRMIKSSTEIDKIREAIDVTHYGLSRLIARMRPGVTEFELDGVLEAAFKERGAQFMGFGPIVGSGMQSTVLHYRAKTKMVEEGELLLLDVGAQWDHYSADISRTFPVDGQFTDRQGEIYDIVYRAQQAAIAAVRPGATIREVHDIARGIIADHGYGDHYLHGTSHHLGLLVHDVADYAVPLKPGMVITVEPGIYIEDEEIGVRIEDDVLVTDNGREVLSGDIPSERKDVESWIREATRGKK